MAPVFRLFFAAGLLLLPVVPAQARQVPAPPDALALRTEQSRVVDALQTVVALLRDVTREHAADALGTRLQALTHRLTDAAAPLRSGRAPDRLTPDDLRALERLLRSLYEQVKDLRDDLDYEEAHALAERLAPVEQGLREAVHAVRDLAAPPALASAPPPPHALRRTPRLDDRSFDARRPRHTRFGRTHPDRDAFVGEVWNRWPFRSTAVYRPIPSFRYNRVEGLVLGIGRGPLEWDSYGRGKVFGQAAYAFSLDRWRYTAGAEARLGRRYGNDDFDLKLGGDYHRNTATNDLWKAGWAENTLAAFFFREDFFDYFETEGWTLYAVAHLTPYVQAGAAFRQDAYRSLRRRTSWSLFGGDGFRPNPPIDEGDMNSFVLTLEGGHVRGLSSRPRGLAFRLEAELGRGLGGDFAFNRYLGDVRLYAPLGPNGLALRLRGGLADGAVPYQKGFTLGGIGSTRAYPQNAFFGTRMLLANAEFTFYEWSFFDDVFLNDVQLFGLFDAGWVNDRSNRFDVDDVLPSAGFGVALDDRHLRLELSWPLRTVDGDRSPSLWLRLNPTF